jgi:hypothetical protein
VLRDCAALVSFVAVLSGQATISNAADHLEAPGVMGSGDLDINDLYVFQSPNDANTAVLAMTVNPFAAGGASLGGYNSGTAFRSAAAGASYQFHIENDAGAAGTDLTYTAAFGDVVGGTQSFTLTRTQVTGALAGTSTVVGASSTGLTGLIATGGQVTAGQFDDPFFFDFVGFNETLAGTGGFTGTDTFAGANVSAIVFEVPITDLTNGSTNVAVRAVTTLGGAQFDQMGRPAINTALIPAGRKDEFNESDPADQFALFEADVEASIASLNGGDTATASALADILLPDLLTVDLANGAGYLNGRGLQDDVIDATLDLVTNSGITTDGVDFNVEGFQSVFPFLQVANVSAVPEPSSVALLLVASGGMIVRRRKR